MKAGSLNAKDLFGKNVRYVIPTFQRPYVWDKAYQWEPLWEDVEHAADDNVFTQFYPVLRRLKESPSEADAAGSGEKYRPE